jgi:tubulin polyglutamylase TTLL6/13
VSYEPEDETATIFWQDASTGTERIARLKPWQHINKVPGIQHIARKNLLGKHLNGMREMLPGEFDFFPQTWTLPHDYAELRL